MKTFSNFLLSVLIFIGLIFLCILIFKGAQFVTAVLYPLIYVGPTLIAIGVITSLLSLVPPFRFMLHPTLIVSYLLGFLVFIDSAFLVLDVFNIIWLLVGVLLCGFGIFPIAIIACICHGLWNPLFLLLAMAFFTAFFRWFVARRLAILAVNITTSSKPADYTEVK